MSEALRKREFAPAPAAKEPLRDLLPPLQAELNDNEAPEAPRSGERIGFEIPPAIWRTMVACYGVFLAAMMAATGGAYAAFAIAISLIYVIMFFGTARVMLRHAAAQPRSPLERAGGELQTMYGPLGARAVVAQMLIVPGSVAVFGIAVLVIRLAVA